MARAKRPKQAKSETGDVSARWLSLFRHLPGYDPVATAAPGQYFDEKEASKACDFFEDCLHHIEGRFAGEPFVLGDWQRAIVGCLFGWKRADGTRRYRTAFLGIPRGNGKTPLAAGICLYLLFCDNEPGAQIYGVAADSAQATVMFRHARGFVDREDELSKRCRVYGGYKSIALKADKESTYKVVSSDASGKHGYSPHAVLADELHAWQGRELMEAFDTAFSKRGRKQPMMVMITTRDFDGRESVCNEKWRYAESVRDQVVADDQFFPVIYSAGDEDDWTAESTWEKANPNIDVSVDRESLRRFVNQAKAVPAKELEFKRLHLNQRTDSANPWISLGVWDKCAGDPIDERDLVGLPCYAGLDLSSTRDLTAFVMMFPDVRGKCVVLPRFWIPEDSLREREQRDSAKYRTWRENGLVIATPGESIDYQFVRKQIIADRERFNVQVIGIDPWNAADLSQQLERDGINVVAVKQAITMLNGPTKELERMIAAGEIRHGGNNVMRWMISNAVCESDANQNVRLNKRKSTDRIDGIAAMINAIACKMSGAGNSTYNSSTSDMVL